MIRFKVVSETPIAFNVESKAVGMTVQPCKIIYKDGSPNTGEPCEDDGYGNIVMKSNRLYIFVDDGDGNLTGYVVSKTKSTDDSGNIVMQWG